MEISKGIETRQSIRAFKPEPIPKEIMKKILQAASHSPSFQNTQPWEVVVVSGKKKDELAEMLLKLARGKEPSIPDIPRPVDWPAAMETRSHNHGARRLAVLGIARNDEQEREKVRLGNFEFYGAPCALFFFMDGSLGEWSIFDMGLFTENLILAAHELGVESCIQASLTFYASEIKNFFGLDQSKKLVIGLSMGYPDEKNLLNSYRSQKLDPEEFTVWYE
jgi:nitroreductase